MRRGGRISHHSKQHTEAVWAIGMSVCTVILLMVTALYFGTASPSSEPAPTQSESELHRQVEELSKRVKEAEDYATRWERNATAQAAELRRAGAALESAQEEAKSQAAELHRLQTQTKSQAAKLHRLQAENASQVAELHQLHADAKSEAAERHELKDQLANATSRSEQLQRNLAAEVGKRKSLEAELEVLLRPQHGKASNVSGNATKVAGALRRLEAELAGVRTELAEARQRAEAETDKRRDLEAALERSREEAKSAERNLTAQVSKRRAAERGFSAEGEKRRAAEADLAETRAKLEKASSRLGHTEADLKHSKADLVQSRADLNQSRSELREARRRDAAEIAELRRRAKAAAEDAQAHPNGTRSASTPLNNYFHSLYHQQGVALMLGLFGVLSVLGPSSFVHIFLPVVGSAFGGLLASSCVAYFAAEMYAEQPRGFSCMDSMELLLSGNGRGLEYLLWLVLLILGILRWLLGIECSLYAIVDDVVLADPQASSNKDLQSPLLKENGVAVGPTTESRRQQPAPQADAV